MESSTPPAKKAVKKASKAKKAAKKKAVLEVVESSGGENRDLDKKEGVKPEKKPGYQQQEKKESEPSGDKAEAMAEKENASQENRGRRNKRSRSGKKKSFRADSQELSDKSWQIFLAEVSEEGLSLIGQKEAQEVARRSLEVTKSYLEARDRMIAKDSNPMSQFLVEDPTLFGQKELEKESPALDEKD